MVFKRVALLICSAVVLLWGQQNLLMNYTPPKQPEPLPPVESRFGDELMESSPYTYGEKGYPGVDSATAKHLNDAYNKFQRDTLSNAVEPGSYVDLLLKNTLNKPASPEPSYKPIVTAPDEKPAAEEERDDSLVIIRADSTGGEKTRKGRHRFPKIIFLTIDGGIVAGGVHGDAVEYVESRGAEVKSALFGNHSLLFNVGVHPNISVGVGYRTGSYGMTYYREGSGKDRQQFYIVQYPFDITWGRCYNKGDRKINPFFTYQIAPSFAHAMKCDKPYLINEDVESGSAYTSTFTTADEMTMYDTAYVFQNGQAVNYAELFGVSHLFMTMGGGVSFDLSEYFSFDLRGAYDFSLSSVENPEPEEYSLPEGAEIIVKSDRFRGFRFAAGITVTFARKLKRFIPREEA